MKLLEEVVKLIEDKGYEVGNVDATVIAQRPKLLNYIPTMKENISKILKVDPDQVNVKATTEEGLGFTGSGEGISSQAICSLSSMYDYSVDMTKTHPTGCAGCKGCTNKN